MNIADAYRLLATELAAYRELRHDELAQLVAMSPQRRTVTVNSTNYAVEIGVRWRAQDGGDILVAGWAAIDDCGPMRRIDEEFIVSSAPAP